MITATRGKFFPMYILAEPAARNIAACIGYAAMEIYCKYGDGVMIITSADHYIEDVPALTEIFKTAILTAEEQDKFITIGLKPTFPSTGFGYIKYDATVSDAVKPVIEFKEKPDEETAKKYIESGRYAWNSGMFIWRASIILKKLKEYVSDIYADLKKIGDIMNTPNEQEVLNEVYPNICKISIDYAVMESSADKGDVIVIPGDCGWNDVGSWDMMDVLHTPNEDGNILFGDMIAIGSKDSVFYSSSKPVIAIDVEGLVIVEISDAIMVCKKDKAQNVKKIVDALIEVGRKELL